MMWSREQLKENAKQALRRFYWMGFAVCLVAGILAGYTDGLPRVQFRYTVSNHGQSTSSPLPFVLPAQWKFLLGIGVAFLVLLLAAALAYLILVANVISVGKCRFFMESRYFPSRFTTLFSGFRYHYSNVVRGMFRCRLSILLWSLLFVVPGIIKYYEYRLVPYLLAENPSMPTARALELSAQLTDGEKWELFVLDLSFFGWYFLGFLLCGVGILFVHPYAEATYAEMYAYMRGKAFSLGLADANELPDFTLRQ